MSEEDLREAWRRMKTGEPLEDVHTEAMAEYHQRRRREVLTVTLRQPWADAALREAKKKGQSLPMFFEKAVEHWLGWKEEQKAREALWAREVGEKLRELERKKDDAFQEAAIQVMRARAADEASAKILQAWFASIERRIGELDFANVPEPQAEEFLALAGTDKVTNGDPVEG